jgi:hypothetical protein
MRDLLKIASLLDQSGNYNLSDKLYKIAETYVPPVEYYSGVDAKKYNQFGGSKANYMRQNNFNPEQTHIMDGSQYYDNPYTPKDILKLRNQLIPTNFRNQLKRINSGDTEISSSNPTSFANNLWEFARKNNIGNSLTNAFDAYADSGATYNGQSIKNIPQLRDLYMYIKNNPIELNETEIAELIKESFSI